MDLSIFYNSTFQISILLVAASVSSCLLNYFMMKSAKKNLEIWLNTTVKHVASQLGLSLNPSAKGGMMSGLSRNIKSAEKQVQKQVIDSVPELGILGGLSKNTNLPDIRNTLYDLEPSAFIGLLLKYQNLLPSSTKRNIQSQFPFFDPNTLKEVSKDGMKSPQSQKIMELLKKTTLATE